MTGDGLRTSLRYRGEAMRRLVVPSLLVYAVVLLLLAPAAALAEPTYDQAVAQLFAHGYPQQIENRLIAIGAAQSYLGLRSAGDPADNAGARLLAAELRRIGLRNVRLEAVPIDAWVFHSASLTFGDKTVRCSAFNAGRGTPKAGLTAPVVYVRGGTAADFAAAGDVRGKLVLLDQMFSSWWQMWPWPEAQAHGAVGVIYTFNPDDPVYWGMPNARGVFSNEVTTNLVPLVYLPRAAGEALRARLVKGDHVVATMKLAVTMRRWERGGVGYNVLGELPGTIHPNEMVVLSAHHDTAGPGALDDTGPCVNLLTMAKAMRMSDYRPQRTVVFLFTTGEEYGWADSYYDWLIGSWWAVAHAHKDWPGRVAGHINVEIMAMKDAPLSIKTTPDLGAWVGAAVGADPSLVPNSYNVATPVDDWTDSFCFAASGVPSLVLEAQTPYYDSHYYHTQYDAVNIMDWTYLAKINRVMFRLEKQLDHGLLPYSLKDRADDVVKTIDAGELTTAGANAAAAARLGKAAADFVAAATAYDAGRAAIAPASFAWVDRRLMRIEKQINGNLTAMDAYDFTIYPHQQVLWNVEALNGAISALQQPSPDAAAAQQALLGVDRTSTGVNFSPSTSRYVLAMLSPSYPKLCFGELGHLPPTIDVLQEYQDIGAGRIASALARLVAKRDAQLPVLNARLTRMADVLERVTKEIKSLP
jgi:hypothetical protein